MFKVVDEQLRELAGPAVNIIGRVRRNEEVLKGPEFALRRKRLGGEDIQVGAGDMTVPQRIRER